MIPHILYMSLSLHSGSLWSVSLVTRVRSLLVSTCASLGEECRPCDNTYPLTLTETRQHGRKGSCRVWFSLWRFSQGTGLYLHDLTLLLTKGRIWRLRMIPSCLGWFCLWLWQLDVWHQCPGGNHDLWLFLWGRPQPSRPPRVELHCTTTSSSVQHKRLNGHICLMHVYALIHK